MQATRDPRKYFRLDNPTAVPYIETRNSVQACIRGGGKPHKRTAAKGARLRCGSFESRRPPVQPEGKGRARQTVSPDDAKSFALELPLNRAASPESGLSLCAPVKKGERWTKERPGFCRESPRGTVAAFQTVYRGRRSLGANARRPADVKQTPPSSEGGQEENR